MAIKENQLPTAQEVTENNLIRTVDENGASQNMTVERLGGLVGGGSIDGDLFRIYLYDDDGDLMCNKTAEEIMAAYRNGKILLVDDRATLVLMDEYNEQFRFISCGYQTQDSGTITKIYFDCYRYFDGYWSVQRKNITLT